MKILITGATGLIGSEITRACHEKKMEVNYLTTNKEKIQKQTRFYGFYWNPSTGEIDKKCMEGVGVIIHLAGANVFKKWTKDYKKNIINSRVDSASLLYKTLKENEHQVGHIVAASAIGIYPSSPQKMYYEDEKEVDDSFLGEVVEQWEAANDSFKKLGLRVAKVRTGLVLARDGGALPKMQKPISFNLGAVLGNGRQWQSWIHIKDLAGIYLHIFENGLQGVYNAVAPNPITNRQMVRETAKSLGKKIWLPNVPVFILRLVMGKRARMLTSSQLVASKKIEMSGYSFLYSNFAKALEDLNKKTGN